jgi:hypothetical protein
MLHFQTALMPLSLRSPTVDYLMLAPVRIDLLPNLISILIDYHDCPALSMGKTLFELA